MASSKKSSNLQPDANVFTSTTNAGSLEVQSRGPHPISLITKTSDRILIKPTDELPNTTTLDDPEALVSSSSMPLHTVFTRSQQILIVTMITLGSFFSPLSGQIYIPANADIAKDYHTTTGRINLTITTYMILQGLAPTIVGTFGDTTGRRPAYLIAFSIYFAANIGLATQKSYAALLVLRCFQSAGSSGTNALAYGVIADIATLAEERGKYLGPAAAGVMVASALGLTIGGLLAKTLDWRAIFWFLAIISGSYVVIFALFMPETSRKEESESRGTWRRNPRERESSETIGQEAQIPAAKPAGISGNTARERRLHHHLLYCSWCVRIDGVACQSPHFVWRSIRLQHFPDWSMLHVRTSTFWRSAN